MNFLLLKKATNLIFPNVCVSCEYIIDENLNLCSECNKKINFLTKHYCNVCGVVISDNIHTCGKCIINPPPFKVLRSVFAYDQHSKNMIINFKFFDNLNYVKIYAKWIHQANRDTFQNAEVIIPIPLHKMRLFKRKYNQAALLAKELSKLSNLSYTPFAIKRLRHTVPQAGLSLKQREKNLKKAFKTSNKEIIKNKIVILVDDVVTTGATVRSCSQEILNSGAKEVRVLSLARTVNDCENQHVKT
ncbi:ComF family protein [Wolbachia endosymbiont of Drosophila tsacasi]|uniref:ComF family protein n=1 Tax=Wolbachia endosymbiont of Drosophila tsacasi TaxID=3002579 RepID=UPI0023A9F983|nr:ComF family protein [Wolbachia endosymbiont of Drosophila tsacasi]MDE5061772.1 ComF family protein [Wolbachia endosymbiont of Drosophila tsacasi]